MFKFTSLLLCEQQYQKIISLQGAPKKLPLRKIRYLWNCSKFFRQIHMGLLFWCARTWAYSFYSTVAIQLRHERLLPCRRRAYYKQQSILYSLQLDGFTVTLSLAITGEIMKRYFKACIAGSTPISIRAHISLRTCSLAAFNDCVYRSDSSCNFELRNSLRLLIISLISIIYVTQSYILTSHQHLL